MKVDALEGSALDYWVARVVGINGASVENGRCWVIAPQCDDEDEPPQIELFSPSTTWAQGGPIMEKLGLGAVFEPDSASDTGDGFWEAYPQPVMDLTCWGATPLVAAMRAVVACKFGVEVPDSPAE